MVNPIKKVQEFAYPVKDQKTKVFSTETIVTPRDTFGCLHSAMRQYATTPTTLKYFQYSAFGGMARIIELHDIFSENSDEFLCVTILFVHKMIIDNITTNGPSLSIAHGMIIAHSMIIAHGMIIAHTMSIAHSMI